MVQSLLLERCFGSRVKFIKEVMWLEELREKLLKSIELNGRESEETVRLSQKLDVLIVKEMRCTYANK